MTGRRRQRLWATAEAWGFGPTSKLLAILHHLHAASVFETIEIFCDESLTEFVSGFATCRPRHELLELISAAHSDEAVLLNVMDAEIQILAAANGFRTMYVDSLTHFWQTAEELGVDYYRALAERALDAAVEDGGRLALMNPYDRHWVAHFVATISVHQELRAPTGFRSRVLAAAASLRCGLIVDQRLTGPAAAAVKDAIIVQFGGADRDEIRARKLLKLVHKRVRASRAPVEVIACGSVELMRSAHSEADTVMSSRLAYVKAFARARLIVTRAGLTSMCEGIVTGAACAVLPAAGVAELANLTWAKQRQRRSHPTLRLLDDIDDVNQILETALSPPDPLIKASTPPRRDGAAECAELVLRLASGPAGLAADSVPGDRPR